MELTEAEIQVLAQIRGAEVESGPTDRRSLEKRGDSYWIFREDWSGAFASLADTGFIEIHEHGYRLTEQGRSHGDAYFQERPDLYWYYFRRLYATLYQSEAHKKLCKQVFGRDLCQENMTDMQALESLLQELDLKPGNHVLDLGCGAGGIAEYVAAETGAHVTGIDLSATAIETASARTKGKGDLLEFREGNLNALELPDDFFDAAYSIDSFYWATDPAESVRSIARSIKVGGKLAILIVHILEYCEHPDELEMHGTYVAEAFRDLKIDYQAFDFTADFRSFWPRVKEAAVAFRDEYEREGNAFIVDNYIREADAEFLPAIEAGEIRRYLYVATI